MYGYLALITLVCALVSVIAVMHFRECATRQVLGEVTEAMTGGFVMWDADDRLVSFNSAIRSIYPLVTDFLRPGIRFEDLIRAGVKRGQYPQAAGREEEFVCEAVEMHRRGDSTTERLLPDGRWILIREERTASGGIIGTRMDITGFKRALAATAEARDSAHYMARHDALTGLPNRVLFRERLKEALTAQAAGGPAVAVLCLDLDRFKRVNDRLGHGAGDELLATVAGRLAAEIRRADTVARLGGDEFAILIVGGDVEVEAEALAGRVIASIGGPYRLAAGTAEIGVSLGGAFGGSSDEIVQRADDALYAAKRAGRGAYRRHAGGRRSALQIAA